MRKKRVYKKGAKGSEYDYHGTKDQKKRRAKRNKDARKAKCPKGKEAHHVRGKRTGKLSGPVRCVSKRSNRRMQPKRS